MSNPLNILLVEDSEDDTLLLVNELKRGGYEPTLERVDTAEAMKAALEKKHWDIVIADYVMPHFSGLEALELLKESGLDLPFIIVSGTIGEDIAVETMRAGAHDYIMKDNLKRLMPAIQRELREAKTRMKHKLIDEEHIRLSMAVEQAAEIIVITYPDGVIQYANPAFERITGYSLEEGTGQNISMMKSGEHDNLFYKDLWDTISSGRVWKGHFKNRKKSGDIYEEEATISPVTDHSGKIISYVAVKRDVTDEIHLRRQLLQAQKMEAIGVLTGGIAHDFNNLLTTIRGFTELVMMKLNEADPMYNDLKHVRHASVRAADLTRQLLLFSRKQPMEFTSLNLNTTVNGLIKMLRRFIGEDVTINADLVPDIWAVKADEGNIEQVIMNLVVNARDAMPDGGDIVIKTENTTLGEEYCKVVSYARPGRFIRLSIADTGIGMDNGVIRHIFEPFFTTKETGKGTGLGLAVVYGIIKQHEGWINIHSSPGQGSTFNIYLPAHPGKVESKAKETFSLERLQGNGERILLVEDEADVREVHIKILRETGYIVFGAASAKEALDIFERENCNFHLVFSDMVMPDKTGLQLVDLLLSRRPELPVLLTSGYMDDKSQWSIICQRGFRFLQKPYALSVLLQAVKETIKTGRSGP